MFSTCIRARQKLSQVSKFLLAFDQKSIILDPFILDLRMDDPCHIRKIISFDIYRSLGMPNTCFVKPEAVFKNVSSLQDADWIVFPPYHLVNLMAYVFQKPVFPSINTYHLGFDKVQMTRAFMLQFAANTPHTLIYPAENYYIDVILDQMTFPFVVKEVRNSQGRGVFLIENKKEFIKFAERNEILYVQEYLEIDRDLRVVWVGDRVVLAYWRIGQEGMFLNNVAAGGHIDYENIPEEALLLVKTVCQKLHLNYAGFDVAVSNGSYYLLEYNLFFGTQALNEKKIALGPIIYQYLLEQSRDKLTPLRPILPTAI